MTETAGAAPTPAVYDFDALRAHLESSLESGYGGKAVVIVETSEEGRILQFEGGESNTMTKREIASATKWLAGAVMLAQASIVSSQKRREQGQSSR